MNEKHRKQLEVEARKLARDAKRCEREGNLDIAAIYREYLREIQQELNG